MQALRDRRKTLSHVSTSAEQCAALLHASSTMAVQRKLCGCMNACWVISIPRLQPIPWPPLSTFWGAQLSVCSILNLIPSPTESTGCMGSMAGPCSLLAGWR